MNADQACSGDKSAIWAVMEPIIRAGETYALPRDMDKESALAYWLSAAHEVFVVEEGSATVGTYFCERTTKAAERTWQTAAT